MGSHPVAAVQYTFTHKQYREQHNETECTDRNIIILIIIIRRRRRRRRRRRIHNITET